MADSFVPVTFVADELLTSTKMNLLAANQAGFHDGTALGDGIIVTRHVGAGIVRNTHLHESAILLGSSEQVGNLSGVTSETTIGSLTVDVPSTSRKMRVKIFIPQVYSSVGGDRFSVRLKEDGNLIQQTYTNAGSSSGGWSGCIEVIKPSPAAGSHIYTATVQRDAGTGSLTLYAGATSGAQSMRQLSVELV